MRRRAAPAAELTAAVLAYMGLPDQRYRARPRLRRRRSAGLSLRGLARDFEPERLPPAVASTARWRTGARRRASRQMKYEIAHRSTTAAATMIRPLDPLRPVLDPDVAALV